MRLGTNPQRYARRMSSRARVYATVAVACAAAAAVAIGVAWAGRADESTAPPAASAPRAGLPPLALDVLVESRSLAAELQSAARLYQESDVQAARSAFAAVLAERPGLLSAEVGEAMSRWPRGTIPRLRELERSHPDSALVKLQLGLALYWLRRAAAAEQAWREAEVVEPDSPAAIRAESLRHPEMPQGRPFFVPSAAVPPDVAELLPLQQLAELERRAELSDDGESWIRYGVALQRAGRPVSAVEAFDRAVDADPRSAEAEAAAAVARFDKDDPSAAFSRLGPLGQRYPSAAVVRFHLGLMLLWLRDVTGSREQLEEALALEPDSIYGREAALLLDRLDEAAGTAPATIG
jgi:tetratricopeptide (TPR) repeat protein